MNLRKVEVVYTNKTLEGYFHMFIQHSNTNNKVLAVVELLNGEIVVVDTNNIKFIDNIKDCDSKDYLKDLARCSTCAGEGGFDFGVPTPCHDCKGTGKQLTIKQKDVFQKICNKFEKTNQLPLRFKKALVDIEMKLNKNNL